MDRSGRKRDISAVERDRSAVSSGEIVDFENQRLDRPGPNADTSSTGEAIRAARRSVSRHLPAQGSGASA